MWECSEYDNKDTIPISIDIVKLSVFVNSEYIPHITQYKYLQHSKQAFICWHNSHLPDICCTPWCFLSLKKNEKDFTINNIS